jgi:hypothetical protein
MLGRHPSRPAKHPTSAPDVSTDAADQTGNGESPADDAFAIAEPTETAEDPTKLADEPQQGDRPDDASPYPEIGSDNPPDTGEAGDHPDDPGRPTETDEAAPDNEVAPASGLESRRGGDAEDIAGEDKRSDIQLTLDGRPLHEHLDPAGADGGSNVIGDEVPDPTDRTGARIANAENDEQPRVEKLRSTFYREGTDALDTAGKAAGRVTDILSRPPTGHPETRTGPSAVPAAHDGVNVGDTVTALLSTGIVIAEVGRRIHGNLRRRRGT